MAIITRAQCADYDKGWEATFGKKKLSTAERVAAIHKGIYGGNSDPNRCVCAEKEKGRNADTPHRHYEEPPYSCARCECTAYTPAIP